MRFIKATTTPATPIKMKNRVMMGSATVSDVFGVSVGGRHFPILGDSRQGLNWQPMFDHKTAVVYVCLRSKFNFNFRIIQNGRQQQLAR